MPYHKTKAEEVVVKVKSLGISETDFHYYKDGKIGDFVSKNRLLWIMNSLEL